MAEALDTTDEVKELMKQLDQSMRRHRNRYAVVQDISADPDVIRILNGMAWEAKDGEKRLYPDKILKILKKYGGVKGSSKERGVIKHKEKTWGLSQRDRQALARRSKTHGASPAERDGIERGDDVSGFKKPGPDEFVTGPYGNATGQRKHGDRISTAGSSSKSRDQARERIPKVNAKGVVRRKKRKK